MAMRRSCVLWNVERFFGVGGSSSVARELGAGRAWTSAAYERKVFNIAQVLRRALDDRVPAFLALTEVESTQVLDDLREALGWRDLVSTDELAPDATIEGLDVTLMLDRTLFNLDSLHVRSVALDNRFATRDLLEARVELAATGDLVAFFVAHWPSRLISEGEALRFAYSVNLQRAIRAVLQLAKHELVDADGEVSFPEPEGLSRRWSIPCLVMGDFNDEPFDPSVRQALGSTRFLDLTRRRGRLTGKSLEEPENYLNEIFTLYNPCWDLAFSDDGTKGGTYYRTEWRIYDQVLFSHGAVDPDSVLAFVHGSMRAIRLPRFEVEGRAVDMMTSRVGAPRSYEASSPEGVSDHFPLRFEIELKTE